MWVSATARSRRRPAARWSTSIGSRFPDFEESRDRPHQRRPPLRNVYPHNLGRQYHIMTQRGCPYSCSFCIESWYQDQHGKKDRCAVARSTS